MEQPLLIYVHGFNSSPQSTKARIMQAYMARLSREDDLLVPALSHWPQVAIEQLQELVEDAGERPVTLVGSSLGGFYSHWLVEEYANCRTVLVNPAVDPARLLREYLGSNQNLYTEEAYMLTPGHLAQLEALYCQQISRPDDYLLLTQSGDETLDYREGVDYYAACPQFVQPGGNHGFVGFERLLPAVLAFSEGRLELPPVTPV